MNKLLGCILVSVTSILGLGCGSDATEQTSDPTEPNYTGTVAGNTTIEVGVKGVSIQLIGAGPHSKLVSLTTSEEGTASVNLSGGHFEVWAKKVVWDDKLLNDEIQIGTTCFDKIDGTNKTVPVELGQNLCKDANNQTKPMNSGPYNTDYIVTYDDKAVKGAVVTVDSVEVGKTESNGILNANVAPELHNVSVTWKSNGKSYVGTKECRTESEGSTCEISLKALPSK